MKFPDSELWGFSTQTFQIPEVESSCIKLQNEFSADVNILLYCCWLGEKRMMITEDEIKKLQITAEPWQETILKPLRNARNMMKDESIAMPANMVDQTVGNISEMELNAEHMEILSLENAIELEAKTANSELSATDCSAQNLYTYLRQVKEIQSLDSIGEHVTTLLNGVYQDDEAVMMALMSAAAS